MEPSTGERVSAQVLIFCCAKKATFLTSHQHIVKLLLSRMMSLKENAKKILETNFHQNVVAQLSDVVTLTNCNKYKFRV